MLARAADLYGGSDPISHLALWAITWKQKLRLGVNDFTESDTTPLPEDVQVAVDNGAHQALIEN